MDNWEKEFDETDFVVEQSELDFVVDMNKIKSFIRTLLEEERKELVDKLKAIDDIVDYPQSIKVQCADELEKILDDCDDFAVLYNRVIMKIKKWRE